MARLRGQTVILTAQDQVLPGTYTLTLGNQKLAVEITEPPFWAFAEVLPEAQP
jgi:hypothetical protein